MSQACSDAADAVLEVDEVNNGKASSTPVIVTT
jgi:hypothetical protein